ncbi:MAG: mechanosensitive ion channel family protein [Lachnospiraceae bacterium]|nr:mechanosensitive ion channel family protein [Lachnospiraceae bacterium]
MIENISKIAKNASVDWVKDVLKNIDVPRIIGCIVIIVVAIIIWKAFKHIHKRYVKKNNRVENSTASHVLYGIVRIIIVLVALLSILSVFGVNISSAVAGLGIGGVVVGFALQDFLKDIIMGIHILSDKFYDVGDAIEFQGEIGIVKKFSLRTTEIELITDRSRISICNRLIESIKKVSDMVDLDIPLSYNEDVRYVHQTLGDLSKKIAELKNVYSCKYKGTERFEDSAIIYKIRFFCNPDVRLDTRRAAITIVQDGLNAAGIKIPFNQLDVHFDK